MKLSASQATTALCSCLCRPDGPGSLRNRCLQGAVGLVVEPTHLKNILMKFGWLDYEPNLYHRKWMVVWPKIYSKLVGFGIPGIYHDPLKWYSGMQNPSQDAFFHHNDTTFLGDRGSRSEPSFATVTGWGMDSVLPVVLVGWCVHLHPH